MTHPKPSLMAQALCVQEAIDTLVRVVDDLRIGTTDLLTAVEANEGRDTQVAAGHILTHLLRLDGCRWKIANEVMGIGEHLPDQLSAPLREALAGLQATIAARQEES